MTLSANLNIAKESLSLSLSLSVCSYRRKSNKRKLFVITRRRIIEMSSLFTVENQLFSVRLLNSIFTYNTLWEIQANRLQSHFINVAVKFSIITALIPNHF